MTLDEHLEIQDDGNAGQAHRWALTAMALGYNSLAIMAIKFQQADNSVEYFKSMRDFCDNLLIEQGGLCLFDRS